MILVLTKNQAELLRRQASKEFPVEACALLFGKLTADQANVYTVVPAINKLQSSVRFEVDTVFVYSEFKKAEEEGLEFIGIFHSHSAPAEPSEIDLRFMKLWGSAIWLILSFPAQKMVAFQKIDGELKRVEVKLK